MSSGEGSTTNANVHEPSLGQANLLSNALPAHVSLQASCCCQLLSNAQCQVECHHVTFVFGAYRSIKILFMARLWPIISINLPCGAEDYRPSAPLHFLGSLEVISSCQRGPLVPLYALRLDLHRGQVSHSIRREAYKSICASNSQVKDRHASVSAFICCPRQGLQLTQAGIELLKLFYVQSGG